jgi:lipopolysaccharide export system protein LptA
MNLRFAKVFLLATALVFAYGVQAKSTDRQQPMDIDAENTEVDLGDNGDSVMTGNVNLVQGTMRTTADRAVITRRNGDITQIVLTGAPVTMKQIADNGDPIDAVASKVVYQPDSDIMVLTGNVVVKQPRGSLNGETIKYNMTTNRVNAGDGKTRVKMRILPKNKSS